MKSFKYHLLLVATLFMVGYSPASWAGQSYGTFRVVKGEVNIKNAKGQVQKARIGAKVYPTDTIVTGKDSRAKVVMMDENVIDVSPDSEIGLEKYVNEPEKDKKDVLINVIYGKVRAKVSQKYDEKENKFHVKTPSAVAGVRGTDFFTSFNPSTNASSVITFEGSVAYGLPGANGTIANAVPVKAGQMAQNSGGKAPGRPVDVPKQELAKADASSDTEKAAKQEERAPADDNKGKKDKEKEKDKDKDEAKKDEPKKDEAKKEDAKNDDAKNADAKPDDGKAAPADAKGDQAAKGDAPAKGPAAGPGGAPAAGDSAAAGPGGMPGPAAGGDNRGPASMPPAGGMAMSPGAGMGAGSMILPGDIVSAQPGGFMPNVGSVLGSNYTPPPGMNFVSDPTRLQPIDLCGAACQNAGNIIQNGSSHLTVNIKK